MSNTEIVILVAAMLLSALWLGIFVFSIIDNRFERDLDQKTWERIEGWRK